MTKPQTHWFVYFKLRFPDGSEGPWRAHPLPFATKQIAQGQIDLLTTMKATNGQQEYAAAVVKPMRL